MTKHHFHLTVQWPGGRNGVGTVDCGHLQTRVSIDRCMDGPGVGTNPDEMLLSAAGSCYFMTLAALIQRAGLTVESMALESEMTVGTNRQGGFVCETIVHRPQVTLSADASTDDMDKLTRLVVAADRHCMVSNALQGNVEVQLHPELARR